MPRNTKTNRFTKKYPHINYVKGEDLNIERMRKRVITKCWYKFETLREISEVTGVHVRTLARLGIEYGLPLRRTMEFEEMQYMAF